MAEISYRLTCGRRIAVVRLHVDHAYAGVLEGSDARTTPHLLARVHEIVRAALPPGRPLLILKPSSAELPPHRLIAELESPAGITNTDPDWASRLFVCWFVENVGRATIPKLVKSILPLVDWEAHAEEFDITLL